MGKRKQTISKNNKTKNKQKAKDKMSNLNFNITIITLNVNHIVESKRIGKIHYANINQEKAGIAILISDKVDFRAKKKLPETETDIKQ